MSGVTPNASAPVYAPARPKPGDHLVEDQQDVVRGADLAQALEVADGGGMTTPAEPANGSTITAAMFDASCSAIRSSSSSASSAPRLGHAARERVRLS